MPTMPGGVVKGPMLSAIDANSRSANWVSDVRTALYQPDPNGNLEPVADIAERFQFANQNEAAHLRTHWFNPVPGPPRWWPEHQLIQPLVRKALHTIFTLCLYEDTQATRPRHPPIFTDCYWMCASERFEVVITCNDHQVNALMITPPPPGFTPWQTVNAGLEPIWIVKHMAYGTGEDLVERLDADRVLLTQIYR